MRIRKLHAWDEWHEANAAFPSKRWANNAGAPFSVLNDETDIAAPGATDTAKYTQTLTQTGHLRYYWSMESATAAPFDMSHMVCVSALASPFGDYYRIQQTDTNLILTRRKGGVITTLQNIALAAAQNTEYWYVFDITYGTGEYLLYRATHASPEDDTAALQASGTDGNALAGAVNQEILHRGDGTRVHFDHFKVMGPNITNYVNLHCETPITDGCGSWKMEAVNTSGTNTYADLALGDLIEITILDDSVNPPVEWVEFSGWVEELEMAESHSGMWHLSGRDFRSQMLITQTNDSFVAVSRDSIIKTLTDTYASTASERICLTKNDVKAFAGNITRDFKAITPLQAITDLSRECGAEWHHVITRDRRWKVSDVWPQALDAAGAAITIDEADGKVIEVIEHKDGTIIWNKIRPWIAGGPGAVQNDGTSQSAYGQARGIDLVDLRVGVAGELEARAVWWLNNFSSAYRVFELTCAGYIGLYPGEYVTLTLTSYGVVAKTYGCLKRIVGYPEPGLITFVLSEKDVVAVPARMTQRMPWESARRLAGVARNSVDAMAFQV